MSFYKDFDDYEGPFSFDDEFEEDFNDDDSDDTLDDYDDDSESYEEAFEDDYDDVYEPFDDVEPEDGYTNPYKYDDDDLTDGEDTLFDDDE